MTDTIEYMYKKPNFSHGRKIRCSFGNCCNDALYNIKGAKQKRFCKLHKKDDMVKIIQRYCLEEGCDIEASYHNIKGVKPIYCSKHYKPGMFYTSKQYCLDCNIRLAYYNYKGLKAGYCPEHKKEGMIYIYSNICNEKDCNKKAQYSHSWDIRPYKCFTHKTEQMYNIKKRQCIFKDCLKEADYTFKGQKYYIYCSKHKQKGMVYRNNKGKICNFNNCINLKRNKSDYCNEHIYTNKIHSIEKVNHKKSKKINYNALKNLFNE